MKILVSVMMVAMVACAAADVSERAAPELATTGCSALQEQAVVATLPKLGSCIIQAAGSDLIDALTDPYSLVPAIAAACSAYGIATAAAIAAVIESWFAGAPAAPDGGPPATLQAQRLRRVHDAALATIAKAGRP
jgi:hypothetical protein